MKAPLRQRMITLRQALSHEEQEQAAQALTKQLLPWLTATLPAPAIVAAYWPLRGEISPIPALSALESAGYTVALPRMHPDSKILTFHAFSKKDDLVEAAFGVKEPPPHAARLEPSCLLIPMVAADYTMQRLGYGGGFYDATLEYLSHLDQTIPLAVGLAYDFQMLDSVPSQPHDRRMNHIFTPTRHITL